MTQLAAMSSPATVMPATSFGRETNERIHARSRRTSSTSTQTASVQRMRCARISNAPDGSSAAK